MEPRLDCTVCRPTVSIVLFLRGHRYRFMRTRLALVASSLVLAGACSSSTSSYSSSSPAAASASRTALSSPTVSAHADLGQFAAIYGSGMGGQSLAVVGSDGSLHGQVSQLGRFGGDVVPPFASTTNDATYYLNGNGLMRLQPGGTPVHIRDLPGSSSVRVAFAVSPDDKRIAIATLTSAPTSSSPSPDVPKYLGMKLFVEDLDGSNHVDIFSSTTVAEWPVGWHGSDLVIAVGAGLYGFGGSLTPYPYFAFDGIHVADSTTGRRTATLCAGLPAVGLATSRGVLCAKTNGLGPTITTPVAMALSDWSGKETDLGVSCIYGGLQPAGDDIACDTNSGGFVMSPDGAEQPLPTPSTGPDPYNLVCWVGHDHLLLTSRYVGAVLYDIAARTTQQLDIRADMSVGAIPGGF